MAPIGWLITLIFVLASGAPAKKAYVYCDGYPVYKAGDESEDRQLTLGGYFVLDSRGAVILTASPGSSYYCHADFENQHWEGSIKFDKDREKKYVWLEEQ